MIDGESGGATREAERAGPSTAVPLRLSITIPPGKVCFDKMRWAIEHVRLHLGVPTSFHPHITLQMTERPANLDDLRRRLREICCQEAPVEVTISELGLLSDRSDPSRIFLTYNVLKSPELLRLYHRVTAALTEAGALPSLPDPETWVPHLTVAHGPFDQGTLMELQRELAHLGLPCTFVVEDLLLNRQLPNGEWQSLDRFRLTGCSS